MSKQIGNLHLKVVLAGEPVAVRSAYNEGFVPYGEGARISHHLRLRFARRPSRASFGIVELGKVSQGNRADAESGLLRVSDRMDAHAVAYARRLIDELHRTFANRSPIESFGGPYPRFWLAIEVEGAAEELLAAVSKTTRIATIWDYEAGMYVSDGHGPSPVLRSFTGVRSITTFAPEHLKAAIRLLNEMSAVMARANRAREAVVEVGAHAVLQELADDWLANGSALSYAPWRSFVGGNDYWLDTVELDFLAANFDEYRELRRQMLEQEAASNSRMPALLACDEGQVGRATAIARN